MTVLGLVDVSAGPDVVVAGLITVGPCLAAISRGPRTVVAVGAYALVLLALLSGADNLWWTTQQLIYVLALVAVTVVSAIAAVRREEQEERLLATEAARSQAAAANAAKNDLLSRVSHELRTPLNAVLGFSQLLARDELSPAQTEAVGQVRRAGEHLLGLVDDVLDVTAIEAGGLSLSIEATPVAEATFTAVELVQRQAREQGVTVALDLGDAEQRYILADARRLRQILVNLLSNAIKFNRPQGLVNLHASRSGDARIAIAVSDTGRGIAADDLAKLFVPFERLDAASTGIEGTGMGLAVARGLADAMNGTLTVESTVGEGTTFSLILPETSAPRTVSPPQQHAEPAAPAGAAASARLLYIEDNPSNLRLVERILERRPAWVMTHADRAAPGLKLALATRFDLILLDQHLPDGEGVSILEPLRARDDRVDVPVVMVTADASPGQRERAASAGANGYLVKPFTIRELLSVLDAWAPDPACPRKESNLQPSD